MNIQNNSNGSGNSNNAVGIPNRQNNANSNPMLEAALLAISNPAAFQAAVSQVSNLVLPNQPFQQSFPNAPRNAPAAQEESTPERPTDCNPEFADILIGWGFGGKSPATEKLAILGWNTIVERARKECNSEGGNRLNTQELQKERFNHFLGGRDDLSEDTKTNLVVTMEEFRLAIRERIEEKVRALVYTTFDEICRNVRMAIDNTVVLPDFVRRPPLQWKALISLLGRSYMFLTTSSDFATNLPDLKLLCWVVLDTLQRTLNRGDKLNTVVADTKSHLQYDDCGSGSATRSGKKLCFTEKLVTMLANDSRKEFYKKIGLTTKGAPANTMRLVSSSGNMILEFPTCRIFRKSFQEYVDEYIVGKREATELLEARRRDQASSVQRPAPVVARTDPNDQQPAPVVVRTDPNDQQPASVVARTDPNDQQPASVVARTDPNDQQPASVVARTDPNDQQPASVVARTDQQVPFEPEMNVGALLNSPDRLNCSPPSYDDDDDTALLGGLDLPAINSDDLSATGPFAEQTILCSTLNAGTPIEYTGALSPLPTLEFYEALETPELCSLCRDDVPAHYRMTNTVLSHYLCSEHYRTCKAACSHNLGTAYSKHEELASFMDPDSPMKRCSVCGTKKIISPRSAFHYCQSCKLHRVCDSCHSMGNFVASDKVHGDAVNNALGGVMVVGNMLQQVKATAQSSRTHNSSTTRRGERRRAPKRRFDPSD